MDIEFVSNMPLRTECLAGDITGEDAYNTFVNRILTRLEDDREWRGVLKAVCDNNGYRDDDFDLYLAPADTTPLEAKMISL
jgi:hypothetical protein